MLLGLTQYIRRHWPSPLSPSPSKFGAATLASWQEIAKVHDLASQVVLASSRSWKTSYEAIKFIHSASLVFDQGWFCVRTKHLILNDWEREREWERTNQGWLTSIESELSQSNNLGAGPGKWLERSGAIIFLWVYAFNDFLFISRVSTGWVSWTSTLSTASLSCFKF